VGVRTVDNSAQSEDEDEGQETLRGIWKIFDSGPYAFAVVHPWIL